MHSQRAQVSLEYVIIVGFLLVLVLPVFYYAMQYYSSNVAVSQVEESVATLVQTADSVYLGGPGTRKVVWIALPGGVTNTSVAGRHVSVIFNVRGNENEAHGLSQANLTGSVPAERGTFSVVVETLASNVVLINTTS